MAEFHPEPIWAKYHDQFGRVYWRKLNTWEIGWDKPMLVGQGFCIGPPPYGVGVAQHPHVGPPDGKHPPFGQDVVAHLPVARPVNMEQEPDLAVGMDPHMVQPINFFPSAKAIADAWEKHFDEKQKKYYWHNTITKETTWKKPAEEANKPPPPPPPPSPPKVDKREQDLWFKVDDGNGRKKWQNEKTGESQYGVPDCRKKYT